MLERVSNILRLADQCSTSAIAFICTDYNMVYSVVTTAEKTNTPVIVMLLPEHVVMDAVRKGFDSVMIDASSHELEENIAITAKVVETAHIFGVDVEAEIGHVGLAQDCDGDKSDFYTKADAAERFCRETGCDSLTIAIGNAHGVYVETPHLDIARLEEINAATDVPLVLHGGSGIPHDQLEIAFTKGINKFNVGTEFLGVYYDAVTEYVKKTEGDGRPLKMLEVPMFVQERLEKYLEEKLKLSRF